MPETAAFVIGNGFVKTYSRDKQVVFPSVIATEQAGIDFSGFKSGHDFVIEFEDQRIAVGETAWKLGRLRLTQMDRSRVGTDFYRQLFAAALVATIRESGPVNVILTLPVAWYTKRDAVKNAMKGEYVVVRDRKTYVYEIAARNIRIVPEGFGVLALQMLDEQGCITQREIAGANVGIVEIGTGTTDLTFFESLELIPVRSKGLLIGLKDVWEGVRAEISEKVGRELELHQVDEAIRKGSFKDAGKVINVRPMTETHMPSLANSIAGQIGSLWDGGRLADGIYVAGGGGPQCYPYFSYDHAKCVDKSYIADATGAYRYALFQNVPRS